MGHCPPWPHAGSARDKVGNCPARARTEAYLPVCPKLQDSQYLVLEDAVERSEYTAIVRDKLLRCPMLVVCSRNQDATTNAQIGLAQKYNRIVTTLDGLKKAVSEGDDLVS